MSRSSLRDAAAIASTFCQIAKGVVASPNGASKAASRGPSAPWPTQTVRSNSAQDVDAAVATSNSHAVPQHVAQSAAPSEDAAPAVSRPWPSKSIKAEAAASTSNTPPIPTVSNTISEAKSSEATQPTSSKTVPFDPPSPAQTPSTVSRVKARPVETTLPEPILESIVPSPEVDTISLQETTKRFAAPQRPSASAPSAPLNVESASPAQPQTSNPPIVDPPLSSPTEFEEYDAVKESKHVPLRAAKVPSSRLGRLFHYGGLGAGLAFGAAGSLLRGASSGGDSSASNSLFMSEQNVARLVDKLSTMRGAALKLGQFLSIQETKLLPPQIEQVLLRVQNSANYMPVWQMNKVMSQELRGADWRERHFKEFQDIPFASASIGQVHSAVLRDDFPDPELAGQKVAVKVQFPGVLESIDSDLSYLRWLVSASALLPKGLFLENTLRVLGRELKDECDYQREAEMGRRFGAILRDSSEFQVPRVVDSLCTGKVLTTEMMRGRPLSQASRYPQDTRNRIAQSILNLSLSELFRFRLMQTDPNWSNFLYNEKTGQIQLIDFGATREYSKEFMDNWLQMLQAAIAGNYDECLTWSSKVGYLTGEESAAMERAHVESMIALGEPFRADAPNPYPFEHQTITDRVKAQIPLMLRERLTPPPQETYSLNRKLSGAFLLCARLKAHVGCRTLFERVEADYRFGTEVADAASVAATPSSGNASSNSRFSSPEQRRQFHTAFRQMREQRKHGRNLMDRFPRSKIVLSATQPPDASLKVGDAVESLSGNPTGSSWIQETPSDATQPESFSGIDLTRAATPAEVTATCSEPSTTMGPTLIRGIIIPLKPPPPGPEECCMSGCAHCAYDIYAEDLEDFHARLSSVRTQLGELEPRVKREEWRSDLLGEFPEDVEEGGNEDMKERAQKEVDRVIGDLDPTMRAFLEMERKLKKQEREKAKQQA